MRKPPRQAGRDGAAWRRIAARVKAEEPTCRYCSVELLYDVPIGHPRRGTVDHVIPVSQGGPALDRANLAGACHGCNVDKSDRTPEQWALVKAQREGAGYRSEPRVA